VPIPRSDKTDILGPVHLRFARLTSGDRAAMRSHADACEVRASAVR
jgi:hypothetical protein